MSASYGIAIPAGRESVLGELSVGAQDLGHVQFEGALVCSFQNIPTGRSVTLDTDNFNFDKTGNSRLGQNDVHFGVLIGVSTEYTLFDPVHVVGTGRNFDAGEPL